MTKGIVLVGSLLLIAALGASGEFAGTAFASADCFWDNGAPGGGGWYGYTHYHAGVQGSAIDDVAAEYVAWGSGTFSPETRDTGSWPTKNYASVNDPVSGNHGPLNPNTLLRAEAGAQAAGPVSLPFYKPDSAKDHCSNDPAHNKDYSYDIGFSLVCDATTTTDVYRGGILHSGSGDADGNHYFAYGSDDLGVMTTWGFTFDSELVFTNSMSGMTTVSSIPSDAVLLRHMVWTRGPACSLVTISP